MPYKAKGKCVYKKDTGEKVGCTKGPVSKYLAALHANVPDAKNEETENPMKKIKLSEMAKKIMESQNYHTPSKPIMLNGKEVDPESIEIDGIDRRDYPDFADAYIAAASYTDGTPVDENDLGDLEDQNYGLVNNIVHDRQLYMEGEEEEFRPGGKMAGQWYQAQKDLQNTRTCKKCNKKFIASYGEHERCPDCLNKQHAAGEKATGTQ